MEVHYAAPDLLLPVAQDVPARSHREVRRTDGLGYLPRRRRRIQKIHQPQDDAAAEDARGQQLHLVRAYRL